MTPPSPPPPRPATAAEAMRDAMAMSLGAAEMPSLSMQESHRAAKDGHPREPARWATSEGEGGGSAVRKEGWGWGVFKERVGRGLGGFPRGEGE